MTTNTVLAFSSGLLYTYILVKATRDQSLPDNKEHLMTFGLFTPFFLLAGFTDRNNKVPEIISTSTLGMLAGITAFMVGPDLLQVLDKPSLVLQYVCLKN